MHGSCSNTNEPFYFPIPDSPKVLICESVASSVPAFKYSCLPRFQGLPSLSDKLKDEACLVCMGKSKMYASGDTAARPEFTGAEKKLQQKKHQLSAQRINRHQIGAFLARLRVAFTMTCHIIARVRLCFCGKIPTQVQF